MAKMTVEDSSLTAVADAIRTKGGTTDPLTFPDGFVSAINGIDVGGETIESYRSVFDRSIRILTPDMLEGLKSIGRTAFSDCINLEYAELPEGIVNIEANGFFQCNNLKTLILPSTLRGVAGSAFRYINNLELLKINAVNPPVIQSSTFSQSTIQRIVVPIGSLEAYKGATNWSGFADIMEEDTQ